MADTAVTGISEFRDSLKRGFADQRQKLKGRLNELGIQMTAEIRMGAPKKTGALAASVRYRILDTDDGERLEILIGNEVAYYAPHVEFGTAQAPAHPFVRPVAYRHENALPNDLEKAIAAAWESK